MLNFNVMRWISIIWLSLVFISCKAQLINETDCDKYLKAYNYILNADTLKKINKPISISDSIVYLELSTFYDEIQSNASNKLKILDSLNAVDTQYYFDNFYSNKVTKWNSKNKDSSLVLFFSKPNGDYLAAELFDRIHTKNISYRQAQAFNSSIVFLFQYDNSNNIINVWRKYIAYD